MHTLYDESLCINTPVQSYWEHSQSHMQHAQFALLFQDASR